jgi:hypothetical protein
MTRVSSCTHIDRESFPRIIPKTKEKKWNDKKKEKKKRREKQRIEKNKNEERGTGFRESETRRISVNYNYRSASFMEADMDESSTTLNMMLW